jgi:hypothetical protein
MEEIESPTESLEEEIHHHATHESSHLSKDQWVSQVALSSAIFAVLAAISALLSNHHANEAMIEQIQASDKWGYYQAKGIKANLLASKLDLLHSLGKRTPQKEQEKVAEYKKEQEKIAEQAQEKQEKSERHLKTHSILAREVTLFQIAISITAISILSKKQKFWLVALGISCLGLGFLIQAIF